MPMMGRGSDTRMYAPRSESETMYSSANEDGTKYSGNTPEEKEKKEENRKLRAEERKQRRDKIKHIKIRSSQGLKGEELPVPEDDSNKQDDEREISLQGGPAGSRGNLLDLATGAKTGTGSAMTGPLPIAMSEPMKGAWSTLLKRETPKGIESRRRREKRQQFRPSTGQFKRPPGGMNPVGATMRRFRAQMRGIKGGKKTGLMKPHLSVEMSHRGIATKQPMSKDPQRYRQYMGQSEARKILGNVRSTFSPHARYGERSVTAGPTGAGRLGGLLPGQSGQMRQPSLKQIGIRRPRLRRPRNPVMAPTPPMGVPSPPMQAPSSISPLPQASTSMMMSEERAESDLLKGRRGSLMYHKINLLRRLIAAQERAEKLGKSMQGSPSAMESGHVPSHPAGVQQHEDEDEKNDGPTQNLETNSSRLGLDPAGYLTSKRGHMG